MLPAIIRQVFEELVQQILILEFKKEHISFKAEYSEVDESTVITIEYDGQKIDPERVENELAMVLIKHAVSDLTIETIDGSRLSNRIFLHLRP